MEKSLELFAKLISGECVSTNENRELYEEFNNNTQVYETLTLMLKKLNMTIYQYKDSLFVTAGENNRIFGYSNEEMRKMMNLKSNRELYMVHFIIYNIITQFYKDTANFTFMEYIKIDDLITGVDSSLANIINNIKTVTEDEVEEYSFQTLALFWDDLALNYGNDMLGNIRASKGTKVGFVKTVLNMLKDHELFIEVEERYYATDRFKALIENYFEEFRGRLFEIMKEGELH